MGNTKEESFQKEITKLRNELANIEDLHQEIANPDYGQLKLVTEEMNRIADEVEKIREACADLVTRANRQRIEAEIKLEELEEELQRIKASK